MPHAHAAITPSMAASGIKGQEYTLAKRARTEKQSVTAA